MAPAEQQEPKVPLYAFYVRGAVGVRPSADFYDLISDAEAFSLSIAVSRDHGVDNDVWIYREGEALALRSRREGDLTGALVLLETLLVSANG